MNGRARMFFRRCIMKRIIVLIAVLLSGFTASAEGIFDPSIQKAHDAYLKSDGPALLGAVRESLVGESNHPVVAANLMALYGKARSAGLKGLDQPDWNLPREIKFLKIETRRIYSPAK